MHQRLQQLGNWLRRPPQPSAPAVRDGILRQLALCVTGTVFTLGALGLSAGSAWSGPVPTGGAAVAEGSGHQPSSPQTKPILQPPSRLARYLEEVRPVSYPQHPALVEDGPVAAAAPSLQPRHPGAAGDARPKVLTYVVQPGDTMWDIAERFAIDEATILHLNPKIQPKSLRVGQEVKILTVKGALHVVGKGETLDSIARLYSVSEAAIMEANGLTDAHRLYVNQELVIPGAKLRARTPGVSRSSASGSSRAASGWIWPLRSRVTSEFGMRWGRLHAGIDLAAAPGTPVQAAKSGRVILAGWEGAYGLSVVIDHGDGSRSRYAHASAVLVQTGDWVNQGEPVIRVGSTGRTTGPHLHFEIIVGGQRQNPRNYLP